MQDTTATYQSAIGLCRIDTTLCFESEAPSSAAEKAVTYQGVVPYTMGIPGQPRKQLPGYDSGVMTLLIGVFLLITVNFRHYSTFIKTFTQNLFSVRSRANAFDERSTVSETRVLVSLISLLCVCEGILLYDVMSIYHPLQTTRTFAAVGSLSLLAAVYYIWQLVAYNTAAYIFNTPQGRSLWIKGFNASQSLLGLTLAVPAVLSLFNPSLTPLLLSVSLVLYVMARLIFIFKGFRIFYKNSFSWLYFILYLCTLEIIPLILTYKAAIFIIHNII